MHTLRKVPFWLVIMLLVYMPFHIFISQSASLVTGGLDAWKVGKDILLVLGLALTVGLVFWTGVYKKNKGFLIFFGLASAYGLLHLLVWAGNRHINSEGALLGTAYNSRLPGYALLGWGATILYPGKISVNRVAKLIILISTVVCVLGILQYLLPKDILTHVGYSIERGVKPNFFIDDKPDLPRIMSTLRDPNSLGAYLILPITLLSLAWAKRPKQRMLISGLLLLHFWALFLTFSRSAWLGAVLSLATAFGLVYRSSLKSFVKKYWPWIGIAIASLAVFVYAMRDQYVVQNVVFHSDENTQMTDSNNLHVKYAVDGIKGIASEPEGHGPGTAGLVSIHTKTEVVLTENYFIQIGYEIGVVGLALLLGIISYLLAQLWKIKTTLASAQIASFFGISLCALLLLTWSNEAVAATWWLLAGVVISRGSLGGESAPKVRRPQKH